MDERTRSGRWITIGALLLALGVTAGALGAHSLRPRFVEGGLAWWETAVLYHSIHGLGALGYGLFLRGREGRTWPGCCFLAGVICFSGSLYAMALGGPRWLGAVTPVGGVLWIVGWLAFALQARGPRAR